MTRLISLITSAGFVTTLGTLLSPALVQAQIAPDRTLGTESSTLSPGSVNGNPVQLIEGGATRQGNLFHSFSEFNIRTGEAAYFANPDGIANILSRVTGSNISNIDGLLGVDGNANLFFLNPNGIIFGPNATLDIRGSFLASTADSIPFTDGSEFSATAPESSLLTISVPLGVQFNSQPQGDVINEANLAIAPEQTLTLLGNTVLSTGRLATPGGTVQVLGNRVGLLEQATIDVSGDSSGDSSGDGSGLTAGGTVRIGGDFQGQATLPLASRTFVDSDVTIAANGSSGGRVIVWSEEATAFYGNISAVGDELGGIAEISGKQDLTVQGTVDLSGADGQTGTLLLDPTNIVIVDGAVGADDGEVLTDSEVLFGDRPVNGTFEIAEETLETLSGDTNLILQATDNITINDLTDDSLVFANGTGSIQLIADGDRNGVGDFMMADTADTLFTNGRNISISGVNLVLGDIDTTTDENLFFFNETTTIVDIDAGGSIPLNETAETTLFTFTVPNLDGVITDVDVRFSAEHTFTSDLIVFVVSPTRATNLFDFVGNDGENFQDTLLSDQALTNIVTGAAPFAGEFSPEGNLSAFNGQSAAGTWLLEVIETFLPEDDGFLFKAGDSAPWGTALGTQLLLTTAEVSSPGTALPPGGRGGISLSANGDISAGDFNLLESGAGGLLSSRGDIVFGDYAGAALRVESVGNITAGDIVVTGPNTALTPDGSGSDLDLLSSSRAAILRAGVEWTPTEQVGGNIVVGSVNTSNIDGGNGGPIILSASGDITTTGFSDNQFGIPDALNSSSTLISTDNARAGGNAGDMFIASEAGIISINGGIDAGSRSFYAGTSGLGGNISISAASNIELASLNSNSFSSYTDAGDGGAVSIASDFGDIVINEEVFSSSNSEQGSTGDGGAIYIFSESGDIVINNRLASDTETFSGNAGNGGAISIGSVTGDIEINQGPFIGGISSASVSEIGATSNAGAISLFTRDGTIQGEGTQLFAFSVGKQGGPSGMGGTVVLEADSISGLEILTLSGTQQAGNVQIQNTDGSLAISNLRLVTSGQVEIPDPFNAGAPIVALDLDDFGQAGNTLITSAGDITFNDVEIQSSANGSQPAGGVAIASPGQVTFNNSQIISNANREGDAGRIDVTASRLILGNGGRLFATTSGSGDGGTITVNAAEAVLLGEGVQNFEPVISVEASGSGRPGNIIINTPNFELSETARITATATETATNLEGGGSISLNANQMNLAGTVGIFAETQGQSPGGVLTLQPYQAKPDLSVTLVPGAVVSASTTSSGNGGDLQILAPGAIDISGSGLLAVETSGTGRGGNITVESQRLRLSDGVTLSASTTGPGTAGNIVLTIADNLDIDGSTVESSTGLGATGIGGNIVVNAATTALRDGGQIAVNSDGQGEGGNVTLTSDQLFLDRSRITANTRSSNGGNLLFNIRDILLLRNGSLISTEAGTAGAGGNGGDITLNLPDGFIVAVPTENSDIRANAFEGDGGNVNVTARSLIGIAFRPNVLDTPLSDITASSRFGNSGTVTINELAPDVFQDNATLPTETAPPALAQGCRARGSDVGSFVSTGRGGLPTNPADPLSADTVWQDLEPIFNHGESDRPSAPLPETTTPDVPIVEAQSWTRTEEGTVILLAQQAETPDHFVPMLGCDAH
ncbi:MAG: filamentous hemagglutinin N-terminal domain-containing protein [Elainellaceae cyanobacterium]